MRRPLLLAMPVALAGAALAVPSAAEPVVPVARDAAPVVLTGAQLAGWSVPGVQGTAAPWPSGVGEAGQLDPSLAVRTAHNGVLAPAVAAGVPVDEVAAYAWKGGKWQEVPVQVDERFPYFLANARSDFSFYSGTDQELTYAWGPTKHTLGEEAWKKMFGACEARYAKTAAEAAASGLVTLGPQETYEDYTGPMADPVAGVDEDDEIALQGRDAGEQAPAGTLPPPGTSDGQTVAVADPLDPTGTRYLYLFRKAGGSSFTARTAAVQMKRDEDADRWLDRGSFATGSPEALGTSNTGYGPNIPGTVCDGENSRASTDRFPSDEMTVTTPTYKLTATGRWMVRGFQVRKVNGHGWGPDLIDRWKGRAFQQSPDSSISVVGFEDEQVNWEANSTLLGWRQGPVRAIREVWGADSGTNVTKTETYYRDADVFRYRMRVHPIPSDGLYTSWDYNKGVAVRYYNLLKPDGVAIDGSNDDVGNVDQLPNGDPAFFDAPDPTFDVPSAVDRPEQIAGRDGAGSVVYAFEFKGATTLTNATAVPYYRDDRCLDDGTGDNPVARPWPGEASTDPRVVAAYQEINGLSPDEQLDCLGKGHVVQGAFGSHGIHFFATHDTDNAALGVPVNEVDGQQWRFPVPQQAPANVLTEYAPNVLTPLVPVVTPFA